MLLGSVASCDEPDATSQKSYGRAYPERRAPTVMQHEISNERWRKAGASADPSKNPAVGDASLAHGNPTRDELIGRGINDRFPGTEQKSNRNE